MSNIGQFVTSKDGTRIWADHAGDPSKPSVVFIPGFSCTALAFEKQWNDPELLKNLHLVRYDIRGQGQSDQPDTEEAYTSVHQAEDFKAVSDAFGLHKPFVAGWSLGGIIPADLATFYGADFISGVILLGSFPWRSMHPEIAHPYIISLVPGLLNPDLNVFYKVVKDFAHSCVAYPDKVPAETKYSWIGAVAGQHPNVRTFSLMRTQDETKLVEARKTLPYLVIQGTMDLHVIADNLVAFMKKTFEDVEIHVLEECGHAPFYDRPTETNKAILGFVQRVTSKA
jgi:pimeloyl-ACP methyl ester carboxylesterase